MYIFSKFFADFFEGRRKFRVLRALRALRALRGISLNSPISLNSLKTPALEKLEISEEIPFLPKIVNDVGIFVRSKATKAQHSGPM